MKIGSQQGPWCNEVCVLAQYEKFQMHPGRNLKVNNFHFPCDTVAKHGKEMIILHKHLWGKPPVSLTTVFYPVPLERKLLEMGASASTYIVLYLTGKKALKTVLEGKHKQSGEWLLK